MIDDKNKNKSTWGKPGFHGLKQRLQKIANLYSVALKIEEDETIKKIKNLEKSMEAVNLAQDFKNLPKEKKRAKIRIIS